MPAVSSEIQDEQVKVQVALKAAGNGSILRGWRKELDPDGSLDCNFLEFCRAAQKMRINVDLPKLFGADSPESLELDEVMPALGALVGRFRDWMVRQFGGPSEMCLAFEVEEERSTGETGDGSMSKANFHRGCEALGFHASQEEKEELFSLLDLEEAGSVPPEDVMFLEVDVKKREGALRKAQDKRDSAHIKELTAAYREDTTNNALPWHHRRAPREWHATMFEQLPALLCEKKLHSRAQEHKRMTDARAAFLLHVHGAFGDPVRAWRVGLDVDNKMCLSKPVLSKYCRANGLKINFHDLWRSLDLDGDGVVRLEEIGPSYAAVLANLQGWCKKTFGSCAALWETVEADEIRSEYHYRGLWRSNKKMPLRAFVQLLHIAGWPLFSRPNPPDPLTMLKGLDFYNCGFVSIRDLLWLDAWDAPPWLSAEPDEDAWEELLSKMIAVHQQPLRAWRRCLDTDDSNCVSYVEFLTAVKSLKFTGNVDGAWRHLDQDVSGTISLSEFDLPSAHILKSFQGWMQSQYGAVEAAFRAMDSDGSGSLSFSELKRACKKGGWDGDVAMIFDCLAIPKQPGKRTMSFKDLEFLDSWMPESVEEAAERALARSPSMKAIQSRHSPTAASPRGDRSPPKAFEGWPASPQQALPRILQPGGLGLELSPVGDGQLASTLPARRHPRPRKLHLNSNRDLQKAYSAPNLHKVRFPYM